MDALIGALAKMLGTFTDPVNVVLLLFCVAEGWFIIMSRREDRGDRLQMIEALKGVTDAMNNVKQVIAANTGRVVP